MGWSRRLGRGGPRGGERGSATAELAVSLPALMLMVFVARKAWRGVYTPSNHLGLECLGLYWHFVDLVWIFLFPLLYLLHGHGGHA